MSTLAVNFAGSTPVALAVLGLGAVLVAWGLFVLAGRLRDLQTRRAEPDAALTLLQQEVEAVRGQVGQQLGQVQAAVASQLQQVTAEVNRRLQQGMDSMQTSQTQMGRRLEEASRAVSEVHGQLGTLTEATRRMEQVGRDIAGLEQILRAPKIRGGLGEILLERLLGEILPIRAYHLQHGFRSGDKVDAAILVGGKLVPVDSKFPLENFRRLLDEPDEERRRPLRRAFVRDVRNRVDEVAKKYIVPDEGTFDFALMYIPAENVYYEVILKDEDGDDATLSYALKRRVIPVSPNSFYAYLQVILLGLRGLRIEENAREILAALGGLHTDLGRFREHVDTMGKHLTNAKNKYDEATGALARLEAKLEEIAGRGRQPALPGV